MRKLIPHITALTIALAAGSYLVLAQQPGRGGPPQPMSFFITSVPKGDGANGRNAVFYGDRAIDRSPCGTGTSARLAHLVSKGRLKVGDTFVHESYIGSRFIGRVEAATELGGKPAIIPSIEGSAIATGFNTIWIDDEDPFAHGFQVV